MRHTFMPMVDTHDTLDSEQARALLALSKARSLVPTDKRKQSLYFPMRIYKEIRAESIRLDRSMSWVVQRAWQAGAPVVAAIPSHARVQPPIEEDY